MVIYDQGGWDALESSIKLTGWTKETRVILVRANPAKAQIREPGESPYLRPRFGEIAFSTKVMPKHDRNRGDTENCFHEVDYHREVIRTRVLRRRLAGKWLPGLTEDAKPLISG